MDALQWCDLRGPRRHDYLPADVMHNAVLRTKLEKAISPFPTQFRFERTWGVIDARVDYPAVAAALMPGEPAFSLEHRH
jgi:hypothetical protein